MRELRNLQPAHGTKIPGTHGDIWPMTWADDDAIHSAASDSKGCPATDSYLVSSEDHGASWSRFSKAHAFQGPFGNPSFVQFGRNNEDAMDDFVYAVSGAEGRWENNDTCILGRVRRDGIMNTESWVFFSGLDSTRPRWGDIGKAKPIISTAGKIGCGPETFWHNESESFLLLTSSYPDLSRELKGYEEAIDACHTRSIWTIFQSNALWGPWKVVYEGPGTGTTDYLPRMPCKWLSGAKGSATVVSAGNFESRPAVEDHYGFMIGTIGWEG